MRQSPCAFHLMFYNSKLKHIFNPPKWSIIICSERPFGENHIKHKPKTPQFSKYSRNSDHRQAQIKFSFEDNKTNEKLLQNKSLQSVLKYMSVLKIRTIYKPCKASQWTGFHSTRVLTKEHLQTDNSILIVPTLLATYSHLFGISLWCHNSLSWTSYYVYTY